MTDELISMYAEDADGDEELELSVDIPNEEEGQEYLVTLMYRGFVR